MEYLKPLLSGLAATLIAEGAFFWPLLRGTKAISLAAVASYLVESIFSLRFWVVGVFLFALFFAASRGNTVVRVAFFWIPTLVVSALAFAFLGIYTYAFIHFRHQ